MLRYLLLGILTALVAGGAASWVRSRSKTEHWHSAPTGWNTHTHEPTPFAASDPETVDPETVEPETLEPETLEPETLEPETLEPETLEPETLEPQTVAPAPTEPEVVDVTAADPAADGAENPDRSDLRG
jgi:hypothetical protein